MRRNERKEQQNGFYDSLSASEVRGLLNAKQAREFPDPDEARAYRQGISDRRWNIQRNYTDRRTGYVVNDLAVAWACGFHDGGFYEDAILRDRKAEDERKRADAIRRLELYERIAASPVQFPVVEVRDCISTLIELSGLRRMAGRADSMREST
jgi:hypothetical protein